MALLTEHRNEGELKWERSSSQFVSLDGVIQDPDGKEGFRVGGWVGQIKDREELNKVSSTRR